MTLCAEVTGMNGILYHVTMVSREVAPEVTETVNIDFGRVAVLAYTRGIGTVGLGAVQPEAYQMRCYFRTHELEGDFTNADVLLDMSDIMVVNRDRGTYVFHDAQYVTAHMERQGDDTHITIDMIGVDNVLYHATMTLQDMTCMHDMEINVDESNPRMVAIQEDCDGESAEYTLQFQNIDSVYDADYNIVGDGYDLSSYTALTVSETMQVKAVVTPSDATNKKVVWEVMQESEVISFENGIVKALAPGQAALVATTEDGEFQAATIFQVSAPEDGTIADFIAAEGKTCYLTGVVSATPSSLRLQKAESPRAVLLF